MMKELINKEYILLRRNKARLFNEFLLALLLIIPIYFTIASMPYTKCPATSLIEDGHEFSSEIFTDLKPLFINRNYSDCMRDNRHLLVSSKDKEFRTKLRKILALNNELDVLEFDNESDLRKYAANPPYDPVLKLRNETCVAVSFDSTDLSSHKYKYTVFTNKEYVPQSEDTYIDPYSQSPNLHAFGWLKIVGVFQALIDSLIVKSETGNSSAFVAYAYMPMHTKGYRASFVSASWYVKVISLLTTVAAAISLGYLISRMQREKSAVRPFMRFVQFPAGVYHASEFLFFAVCSLVKSLIVALVISLFFLQSSHFLALWIGTFLLFINLYPYAVFFNSIFSNSVAASLGTSLGYVLVTIGISQCALASNSVPAKFGWSLFPPSAYALCMNNMLAIDGFRFTDVVTDYYGYRVVVGWLLMLLDFVLALAVALCFDAVRIGSYCPCMRASAGRFNNLNEIRHELNRPHDYMEEDISSRDEEQPQLKSLFETYKGKAFAVYGDSCDISVLLALIRTMKLDGQARVVVLKECQMYDELTVEQHLALYAAILGENYSALRPCTKSLAGRLGLQLSKRAQELTKSEKKLFSLALCLSVNGRVVVLDEPTAGVEKELWPVVYDLICRRKQHCVTFLSTKNFDEAELLADYLSVYSKKGSNNWILPGSNYKLEVVAGEPEAKEGVNEFVMKFRSVQSRVEEPSRSRVEYTITADPNPDPGQTLPELLAFLDRETKEGAVHEFSLTRGKKFGVRDSFFKKQNYPHSALRGSQRSPSGAANFLAISWCILLHTVRSFRVLLLEFALPLSCFVILLITHSNITSTPYTYSVHDLPSSSIVPINSLTRHNESTEGLLKAASGIGLKQVDSVFSENTALKEVARSFSDKLYDEACVNMASKGYLGAYYVVGFNQTSLQAMVFGNVTSPHTPTFFANVISNMFLRTITNNSEAEIVTTVEPLEFYRGVNDDIVGFNTKYLYVLVTVLAATISLTSMAYTLAYERTTQLKSYQLANGLGNAEYWTGKIICDILKLCILAIPLIAVQYVLNLELSCYWVVLVVSLLPCLLFFYFVSFLPARHTTRSAIIFLSHLIVVIPSGFLVPMFKLAVLLQGESAALFIAVDSISRLIPVYNLAATLTSAVFDQLLREEGHPYFEAEMDFHFLGLWSIMVVLTTAICSLLLFLVDVTKNSLKISVADIPTIQLGEHRSSEALVSSGKDFDIIKAAEKIWRCDKHSEESIALVDARNVRFRDMLSHESDEVAEHEENLVIGYCPKNNILFDLMTVTEHLDYYATLKGVPNRYRQNIVKELVHAMGLEKKKDVLAASLCPVNKRKLMIAVAVLVRPTILLLNEPTGFTDTKKKSKLWGLIKGIVSCSSMDRCRIIFVSHFLDEVQTYSTVVGAVTQEGVEYFGELKDVHTNVKKCDADIPLAKQGLVESIDPHTSVQQNEKNHVDINDSFHEELAEEDKESLANKVCIELLLNSRNGAESESIAKRLENVKWNHEIIEQCAGTLRLSIVPADDKTLDAFAFAEQLKAEGGIIDYTLTSYCANKPQRVCAYNY